MPELRKRSTERIAADKDYAYVREDIGLFRKQQADKTLSLNMKQRLKEQDEAEARQKARDRERLARQEPVEKVYELTLKQAALPGLPPPVARTNETTAASSDPSGAGTNAIAAAPASGHDGLDDDAQEEQPPATDAPLVEVQHILMDYLSLLPKGNSLTAGH